MAGLVDILRRLYSQNHGYDDTIQVMFYGHFVYEASRCPRLKGLESLESLESHKRTNTPVDRSRQLYFEERDRLLNAPRGLICLRLHLLKLDGLDTRLR